MAYYTILSPDGYGQFNRRLASLTSLTTAVYWSEILDIISQVVKKKKFDENGFFKLDRKYIEDRTTISEIDQLDLDSILENIGVLERDVEDSSKIRVQLDAMATLLIAEKIPKSVIPKTKVKVSKSQAIANKRAAIISTMKKCCTESDPEVHTKYEEWVDSVYAASRFLSKSKIQIAENTLNAFTTDNKVKIDILNIGIQTGWDNMDWLINRYNNVTKNAPITLAPQKSATEVSDISF